MKRSIWVGGVLGLALAACTPQPADPPQYHEDVAPILQERCTGCHVGGGIAPFALGSYEEASYFGGALVHAVENRTMPPWAMRDDGTCQSFRDSRYLSDPEIDTLRDWVAADMPLGDPAHAAPSPTPTPGLTGTTFTVQVPEPYLPIPKGTASARNDDYRCFLVDPGATEPRVVTAFDALPGQADEVHHVLVFTVDPDMVVGQDAGGAPLTNLAQIQKLAGLEPDRQGWECFGAAGDGVIPRDLAAAWAPGEGVQRYPDGTGVVIQPGHLLVMQVHYYLGAVEPTLDQTQVKLQLGDSSNRPATTLLLDRFLETLFNPNVPMAEIPAGDPAAQFTWTISTAEMAFFYADQGGAFPNGFDLYGVFPHMHERGAAMHMEIHDGDRSTCAAEVPRWDFEWQQFYFYEEPLSLDMGQEVEVTCTFDTSDDLNPVTPGFGTANEMCLMGLYVVPR